LIKDDLYLRFYSLYYITLLNQFYIVVILRQSFFIGWYDNK
jgi:hypothetical protein